MRDRSQRVETDVNVYRLRLTALAEGAVVFGWDYPGSTLVRVRIVRTALVGAAVPTPDPGPDPDDPWQVVYDGDTGSFRDLDVRPGATLRYALFARNGDGPWVLWRDEVVTLP